MTLATKAKFKTKLRDLEDISPEAVVTLLMNVRFEIGKLDSSFAKANLARVLCVVESGRYDVKGNVVTEIDLSSAKGIVATYRRFSEGGCQSCVSMGRETIDAQDAISGWYCEVSDPGYKKTYTDEPGVKRSGFSLKVRKHHDLPCDDWKPKFSPRIEELVKG